MTATIEGIGRITPITKERFEEFAGIWRKCVMLEKGFWDMAMDQS
jgi:hydroxymethylpyrimidine/phosphomethylpyrimidine kinase / thiaminase